LIDLVHNGLDPHVFATQLWTGEVGLGEIDYLETRGHRDRVRRIPGLGRSVRLLGDVRALLSLIRLLRTERPDIIHSHTAKAGVIGRVAAIFARTPVRIHTFHGHVLHGYFPSLATRLIVIIEQILARYTTALVAVGVHVRDDLLNAGIGSASQYVVVTPGVEIARSTSTSDARQRFELPADAPIVLFVGRLTRIKRPDRLVEAFRIVLQTIPKAILVFAGDGELRSELEGLSHDLGDSVRFIGWQTDLSSVYPLANVVVMTSDNEGMPVALIEASMLGIPCVTTNVGSAGEVVIDGRTGFVVDKSPEDVARAVSTILQNKAIAQTMSEAARTHAHRSFSTRRLIEDHAELYKRAHNRALAG